MDEINEMTFEFKNIEFKGLKFVKDLSQYPWNNNKDSEKYFDNLFKEGSHYSEVKYRDLLTTQIEEDIHIKLSYSLIFKVLSILFIFLTVFLAFKHSFIITLVNFSISIISHLFFLFMKRRANELYSGREITKDLVQLIFNQEK